MHRQKADEAYMIGHRGQYTPVGAYLAGDEIIKVSAVGPTKTIPAFSTFRAKSAFSERNP
jgi:pyruvate carboxylase